MSAAQASTRSERGAADDPQVHETRRRLVQALREAAEEDRASVSVTWLCTRAGVARSTFYTHFATVDDLAVFTIVQAFAAAADADVARRSAHDGQRTAITRAGLERVVDAFESTRDDILYAVRLGSRPAVIERLIADFARLTRPTIRTELASHGEAAQNLMAEFVGAGTVHAVLRWMEHGGMTRSALIDQLVEMLPAALTRD
ncbi:hypothetical protein ACWGJP_05850 [Microbacterium sp. NPDC055903]